jgi:hypothetical protein
LELPTLQDGLGKVADAEVQESQRVDLARVGEERVLIGE